MPQNLSPFGGFPKLKIMSLGFILGSLIYEHNPLNKTSVADSCGLGLKLVLGVRQLD